MTLQLLFAVAAVVLAFVNSFLYIHSVFQGKTKPHAFTWGLWSLISAVTFAAQQSDGAGAGAWLQIFNTLACMFIMILGLRFGDRGYTRSDWAALVFTLATIPVWLLTGTPLWSVILLCLIDGMAFWPTLRKSWTKPHEEPPIPYILWGIAALASIIALERITFITAAFPVFLASTNFMFVAGRSWRIRMEKARHP